MRLSEAIGGRRAASSGTGGAGCWSRTCTPWPRDRGDRIGALGTPASPDLARGGGSGRDRQKKRSGPPNTIDLTSRPRGSCGTPPRRPGIRHAWFFSMKPALRTISCGGMVGPSRPRPRAVRPVADQYVSRSAAGDWPDRARGLRRSTVAYSRSFSNYRQAEVRARIRTYGTP